MVAQLPSSFVSSTGRLTDAGLGALYGGGGSLSGILDPGSLISQLTKSYVGGGLGGGIGGYNPYALNPYLSGYYPMQPYGYGQQPDYYSILIATLQQDAAQRYGYQQPYYAQPYYQQPYYGYPQQYPQQQYPYAYQQPSYGYPQQQYYGYPQQQYQYAYQPQQYQQGYQQGYGYG